MRPSPTRGPTCAGRRPPGRACKALSAVVDPMRLAVVSVTRIQAGQHLNVLPGGAPRGHDPLLFGIRTTRSSPAACRRSARGGRRLRRERAPYLAHPPPGHG